MQAETNYIHDSQEEISKKSESSSTMASTYFTPRDKVFRAPLKGPIPAFKFNNEVAAVFDDMVERSIPFYHQIHPIIAQILLEKGLRKGRIYDLGCSTANTLIYLSNVLQAIPGAGPWEFIGIDESPAMIEQAQKKLNKLSFHTRFQLLEQDLREVDFQESEAFILNYTLQFLPIADRLPLLKRIYSSLKENGILILSEKILVPNREMNNFIIDLYYGFKKQNGYSELEISQKREALENVLIPLTMEQQYELLREAGFTLIDAPFRCYNFATFVAFKS